MTDQSDRNRNWTDQSDRNRNWIFKYYSKLRYNKLQCNICRKLIHNKNIRAKVHLFRDHNIDEDDNDDYIAYKQTNLVWQYFTEEEKYAPICNICNEKRRGGYEVATLEPHLIINHKETIERLRNIIRNIWIGQHYKFTSHIILICKICNSTEINIYRIYNVIHHLLLHNINGEIENTVANIKKAINESIENASSTSRTSTHLQAEKSEGEILDLSVAKTNLLKNVASTSQQTSLHLQTEKSESSNEEDLPVLDLSVAKNI